MNRRNFIKNGSAAGISLTVLSMAGCTDSNTKTAGSKKQNETMDDFELNEITIDTLQQKMAAGTYSSVSITQKYLDRIKEIDQKGHHLSAVIELNPDALSIAAAIDAERKNGKVRGPLHGIPVLIKDNIDTGDKMQTTAGALAMEGHIARKDAFIIARLRDSGAVLLGKTNLSEWANFRSTNACSGWSSRGGQTKSPYILDHNPCGSSSGSGVAVAANLCAVAIGTETDGSIVCPASVNGLVGIKPTVGLLSRSGIIPISATQDTAGPLARTVKDAALLLSALTGIDTEDPVTASSNGKMEKDYSKFLDANALKGKRIGVDLKVRSVNTALNTMLDEALAQLKQLGATIVEIDYVAAINAIGKYELEILQYEFKDGVNRYLSTADHKMKTLKDVIEFNKANEAKAMPYFKQEQLENCEKTSGLDNPVYHEAMEKGTKASRDILDKVMKENNLDAITGLTMGPACSIDMIYGDRWGDVGLTSPAAMSGYPHVTLPGGMIYKLPVGLSFFGAAYSEPKLIGMAYAYEQATKKRKAPEFIKAFLEGVG